MNETILVTSALPYVNNVPHLGNIIGSTLSGDIYTRYIRRRYPEKKVIYLCGTDEYGTTTEIRAKQENMRCQEICDKYTEIHHNVYKWFDIRFDIWGRTTNPMQKHITHDIFSHLYNNDCIEQQPSEQYYCNSCQMFLADRYINGICYSEHCRSLPNEQQTNGDQCDRCGEMIELNKLLKIWCVQCNQKPELRQTNHLYLRLGKFQDILKTHNTMCQMTHNARSITDQWLNQPLHSRCITRNLSWGTGLSELIDKYPELAPYKDLVFYVWFDAPIGYLSILLNDNPDYLKLLTKDHYKWVAFMAKDNVPFHSILFPATLIGSNLSGTTYPTITQICSTEYLQYENTKFSKSKNIGVFGDQVMRLSQLIGIDQDYWRYYLTRIRPETRDTSFSWTEFCSIVRTELCNNIGNLINRVLTLATKYFPNQDFVCDQTDGIISRINDHVESYDQHMENTEFTKAINYILQIGALGNQYLQTSEPWKHQANTSLVHSILCTGLVIIDKLMYCLAPIIPQKIAMLSRVLYSDESKNSYRIDMTNYTILFKPINERTLFALLDEERIFYRSA